VKLIDQRTGVINRLHSVLEQGNIKLSNVASNIMGVSGRAMIKAMSQGESDPAKLAALSQGRLKADCEQLVAALDGQLNEKGALVAQASAGTGEDVGGRDRDLQRADRRADAALLNSDGAASGAYQLSRIRRVGVATWQRDGEERLQMAHPAKIQRGRDAVE
jgi:hypothetical protein